MYLKKPLLKHSNCSIRIISQYFGSWSSSRQKHTCLINILWFIIYLLFILVDIFIFLIKRFLGTLFMSRDFLSFHPVRAFLPLLKQIRKTTFDLVWLYKKLLTDSQIILLKINYCIFVTFPRKNESESVNIEIKYQCAVPPGSDLATIKV